MPLGWRIVFIVRSYLHFLSSRFFRGFDFELGPIEY